MNTIWADIPGLKGYQACEEGLVRSVDRLLTYSTGATHLHKGQLLLGWIETGYLRIRAKSRYYFIHVLIAKTFIPNPKRKKTVNHKNGDKLDNRKVNLEWNTQKENNEHARNVLNKPGGHFTKIIDTKTRQTFDSIKEVYKNNKFDFPYQSFVAMLNGKTPNKTNFKKCKNYSLIAKAPDQMPIRIE